MPFLASDVMDQSVIFLNDIGRSYYTNDILVPYVKKANEDLEKILLVYDSSIQRTKSAAISVNALALTLTLPTDFLLPIRLFERTSSSDPWVEMTERTWTPEDYQQVNSLNYWAFHNNAINFPGAIIAKSVLLEYERKLAIISSANSPEDFELSKGYLSARSAELCARYAGMNDTLADRIYNREVLRAEDDLTRLLTQNQQGLSARRKRFTTKSTNYGTIR